MIVRAATLEDAQKIVELGARWHQKSHHSYAKFDRIVAFSFTIRAIQDPDTFSCVAEHGGQIVGFLIGVVQEWPFLNLSVATDLVTLAERAGAGRAMLRAFERWAFQNGADEMLIGVSFGGEDTHSCEKIYGRAGYTHLGGMFAKRRPA